MKECSQVNKIVDATDKVKPCLTKNANINKKKRLQGIYLKEPGEHVERVNSRGTICI